MPRFASGKHAYGISDRSGFRYRIRDMRKEWNGAFVGYDEYEEKHPQLEVLRIKTDPEAIRNARPDRTEPAVQTMLFKDPFTTGVADSGSTVITVFEKNHGRSSSDTVRFRNCIGFDGITKAVFENSSGYSITVTSTDRYTFTVSASSTTGNVKGGGDLASAGPVSLTS